MTPAQDLRRLADRIEQVTRESRAASIAWEQVRPLCDYLCLRAKMMELETEKDERELVHEYDPPRE